MKLSAPKVVTFWIAVALVVLGILASQGVLAGLAAYAFWLVVVGFVVLALGVLMKGM
jgi:threonine/homoserine/homoserine lactone efflux protein